jgi:predicted nucleic acid-binding protein
MKSVGLDTSVVVRLLTGDPESQAHTARTFLATCRSGNVRVCVSDLVVAEAYHALIYHYDAAKFEAVKALLAFLRHPGIHATGHAVEVLSEYAGSGPGLVDRLIRSDLLDRADEVITFDADFARLGKTRRLG